MVFYLAYGFKHLNNFGKYGDFTYGIYIYHFPIIQLFVYLGFFRDYNFYFLGTATVLLIIILAVLSWNLLEIPFLNGGGGRKRKKTW
jgi:peptidoglycan/LPS O-acetylase OafA/YrhL